MLLPDAKHSLSQRLSRSVALEAPWLVLAGSGGLADILATMMPQPHLVVPRVVEKQLKEKFPGEPMSWEDVLRYTQLVGIPHPVAMGALGRPSSPVSLRPGRQLQVVTAHPHLITVYDFEQEGSEELDTVILKALVKGEHGDGGT